MAYDFENSITDDSIRNAFDNYCLTVNENKSPNFVDRVCFYYERGTDEFPFNNSETSGMYFGKGNDNTAVYKASVNRIVNGLTDHRSKFKQMFRSVSTFLEGTNSTNLVPDLQKQSYLMMCPGVPVEGSDSSEYDSLNTRMTKYLSVDISKVFGVGEDGRIDTSINDDELLPLLTMHVLSIIYQNQGSITIDTDSGLFLINTDSGQIPFEKYLLEVSQLWQMLCLSSPVGIVYPEGFENFRIRLYATGKLDEPNRKVEYCIIKIIHGLKDTYNIHELKVYMGSDAFIRDHICSLKASEIYAYNESTGSIGSRQDTLLTYNDTIYNALNPSTNVLPRADIILNSGQYYNEFVKLVKDTNNDGYEKYRRHNYRTTVSVTRNVFKDTNGSIKVDTQPKTVRQNFIIFHSYYNEQSKPIPTELNNGTPVLNQLIINYIKENFTSQDDIKLLSTGIESVDDIITTVYPDLSNHNLDPEDNTVDKDTIYTVVDCVSDNVMSCLSDIPKKTNSPTLAVNKFAFATENDQKIMENGYFITKINGVLQHDQTEMSSQYVCPVYLKRGVSAQNIESRLATFNKIPFSTTLLDISSDELIDNIKITGKDDASTRIAKSLTYVLNKSFFDTRKIELTNYQSMIASVVKDYTTDGNFESIILKFQTDDVVDKKTEYVMFVTKNTNSTVDPLRRLISYKF